MSKYDINQVREALMKTCRSDAWKFCKFDGQRDLVREIVVTGVIEPYVPNSPVIFQMYIFPLTTFGPWDSYLYAQFDATNEIIRAFPHFESPSEDPLQLAYFLSVEFSPDPEEVSSDWMGCFNHLHLSRSDLDLICEAIRLFSFGIANSISR